MYSHVYGKRQTRRITGYDQNKKTRASYLRLITPIVSAVVRVLLAYTRVAPQLQPQRVVHRIHFNFVV